MRGKLRFTHGLLAHFLVNGARATTDIQLSERLSKVAGQGIVGSNPAIPTNTISKLWPWWSGPFHSRQSLDNRRLVVGNFGTAESQFLGDRTHSMGSRGSSGTRRVGFARGVSGEC